MTKRGLGGMRFALYPVVLCAAAAVLCAAVALPYARPYIGALAIASFAKAPEFDERGLLLRQAADEDIAQQRTDMAWQRIVWPMPGERFATLRIEGAGVDAPVYCGDSPEELMQGVGTYAPGGMPGQGRTILMGGHNNTDFKHLRDAAVGDIIEIETGYGVFRYEITDAKELRFDDPEALDLYAPEENLVLYTCTRSIPFGATPWRWFVYGRYLPDRSALKDLGGV